MEIVAKGFVIVLPFFLITLLAEKLYGYLKGNDTMPMMDAIAGGYSGITMMSVRLAGLTFIFLPYEMLLNHVALFSIESSWSVYVLAFIFVDFKYYWGHRINHTINYFWNTHLVHHSSEEFNLSSALRQTVSNFFSFFTLFLIPAAIIGIPAQVIVVVTPLHTLLQYWYHTRHIGKLGFLEHIIVTPSHHRVHHAMNSIYIDKNHSAIFIIWDKLFGTFQEELESEPPVYGITRPVQTYNPVSINFQHLILLVKDAWRAKKWTDKLSIWFRPTGWRPEGLEEQFPVKKIDDVHRFSKFSPPSTKGLLYWSIVQFFVVYFVFIYVLSNFQKMETNTVYLFVIFILAQTFCATELMNRNKDAVLLFTGASVLSSIFFLFEKSFFGIVELSPVLFFVLLAYFTAQIGLAYLFRLKSKKNVPAFSGI